MRGTPTPRGRPATSSPRCSTTAGGRSRSTDRMPGCSPGWPVAGHSRATRRRATDAGGRVRHDVIDVRPRPRVDQQRRALQSAHPLQHRDGSRITLHGPGMTNCAGSAGGTRAAAHIAEVVQQLTSHSRIRYELHGSDALTLAAGRCRVVLRIPRERVRRSTRRVQANGDALPTARTLPPTAAQGSRQPGDRSRLQAEVAGQP